MKVLFLTHHYLSSNGGGTFASRAYINAFAANCESLTLLYPTKEGEDLFPEIAQNVIPIPVTYTVPKVRKALDLLAGRVHRYFEIFPTILRKQQFDLVVFDNSKTSFRLLNLAHQHGCKTIVIHHNFEYEYIRDTDKGLLRSVNLFWTKRYEKEAARQSDLNLTLTQQDKTKLSTLFRNGDQSNFKHLGIFEHCSKPTASLDNTPLSVHHPRFVITGNLSSTQTVESLIPWVQQYYPLLKEVFPNSTLTVAGRDPGRQIQDLCAQHQIRLIASPSDMDAILRDADIYICPTSLGGGMKLRVMDGLKTGLPVLCHERSARGYESFVSKGCLFVYHDIASFKEAVMRLKSTSFSKQSVIETYRSLFSFESGVNRVRDLLQTLQ